jgi:ankyrin repeat protein
VGESQDNVIAYLIKRGADVNAKNRTGRAPLHNAIVGRRTEAARLLLTKDVDLELKDRSGHSPLKLAEIFKAEEIQQLLREKRTRE